MADYQNLKDAIKDVIKTNGNQEITGQIMQNALVSIINALQAGAMYAGVAKPTTNPGTPDQNLFFREKITVPFLAVLFKFIIRFS